MLRGKIVTSDKTHKIKSIDKKIKFSIGGESGAPNGGEYDRPQQPGQSRPNYPDRPVDPYGPQGILISEQRKSLNLTTLRFKL